MVVTLVGAGSLDFSGPNLRSLLPVAARRGLEVRLCDHDPAALADMQRIAGRLCDHLGVTVALSASRSLEEGVRDAAFVIVTLNHGGVRADIADFRNAVEHGFAPKHIDTIGPAGWLRALRMGAFADRLYRALPAGATVLDLSNPLALMVRMAHRRGFRAIGFCHGAFNRRAGFRTWLGLDADPDLVVWGANHNAWMTELRLSERDLYPDLVAFLRRSPEHRGWRLNWELYERYGMMPVLEAQHNADFYPGFESPEECEAYGLRLWEYESRITGAEERSRRRAALASGEAPIAGIHESGEGVAECIDVLVGGPRRRAILNVPLPAPANGVPAGAVIEGWVTVSADGVSCDAAPELPCDLCAQIQRVHQQQDLAAEAFETGDLERLVAAWCLEPNVREGPAARSMLSRALREHRALLPEAWQRWA